MPHYAMSFDDAVCLRFELLLPPINMFDIIFRLSFRPTLIYHFAMPPQHI